MKVGFCIALCCTLVIDHAICQNSNKQDSSNLMIGHRNPDCQQEISYLPKKVDTVLNSKFSCRFSEMQAAFCESAFYLGLERKEAYRFTWLRHRDNPIMIKIEMLNDSVSLYVKELDGSGCCFPGKLILATKIAVKLKHWRHFKHLLKRCNYVNMPAFESSSGFHGADWILEGAVNGDYYFVRKWSPRNGAYKRACLYLLSLSHLKLRAKDIY